MNLIDVQYEALPYVTDPVEAIRPGAPVLHDNPGAYKNAPERSTELPNIQSYGHWSNGDVDAGFKKAARVFEHTFRTPLGFHGYIEPHACTVQVHDDGQIEIWARIKLRSRCAIASRAISGLDPVKVKVHILPVGGDFGANFRGRSAGLLFSGATDRQTRQDDTRLFRGTDRDLAPPSCRDHAAYRRRQRRQTLRVARAGYFQRRRLRGTESKCRSHSARTPSRPPVTTGFRRFRSKRSAPIPIRFLALRRARTAARRRLSPWSRRSTIIARELGMNSVEFRMKNLLDDGDASPFGQKLKGVVVKEILKKALRYFGLEEAQAKHIGRGVAVYERPSGAGKSGAAITIEPDGSVKVHLGVPDVGPGIHTVVSRSSANSARPAARARTVRVEDTDNSPYDSGTGAASRRIVSAPRPIRLSLKLKKIIGAGGR